MVQKGVVQLLSSKLLSQILSAGDLFGSSQINVSLIPIRKKYEKILQKRIFLADRHEKVERAMINSGLIDKTDDDDCQLEQMTVKDDFIVNYVDLDLLKEKLDEKGMMDQLKVSLEKELKDEGWYNIFQTVSTKKETD